MFGILKPLDADALMVVLPPGILDSEYLTVKTAFEASGRCRELFSAQEKEWRGGAFEIIG